MPESSKESSTPQRIYQSTEKALEKSITRGTFAKGLGVAALGIIGWKSGFFTDVLRRLAQPNDEQKKAKDFFEQSSPEDLIKATAKGERVGENDTVQYRNRPFTNIDEEDRSVKVLGSLNSGKGIEAIVVTGRSRLDPRESARWLAFKNPDVSDKLNEYVFALAELFDDPSGKIYKVESKNVGLSVKPTK